ncbi:glucosamine-6-phosphate deaminase [Effusibacillus pohliae]|uniref:glucosamine-6-phosphate deaminase n=1 Tax=Effusibacillus pohliae TaxID=232270 RepID=UPI00036FC6A9|nr:glucosamine-6-phosphate deaminase [Effusibacillus pohliae]
MKILIEKDYEAMSARAARIVAERIRRKPDLVLGLATGSTPIGMYRHWIGMVQAGDLSFTDVTTFNLDEYVGLAGDHPQSFRTFMHEQLFRQIDVKPERTHIPDGVAPDLAAECAEYNRLIEEAGGIDVQILGIGKNGHIGFNEPGEDFGKLTHVVRLSENTRRANSRFFPRLEDVPTHAITMGLKSIMNARQIVLLAAGTDKCDAVQRALYGDVTEDLPASVLQLHPNCVVVLDEAAASKLPADGNNGKWEMEK